MTDKNWVKRIGTPGQWLAVALAAPGILLGAAIISGDILKHKRDKAARDQRSL